MMAIKAVNAIKLAFFGLSRGERKGWQQEKLLSIAALMLLQFRINYNNSFSNSPISSHVKNISDVDEPPDNPPTINSSLH